MSIILKLYYLVDEILSQFSWFTLFLTRMALGHVFFRAGQAKFEDMDRAITFFSSLHIPMPELMAPYVALVEVVGSTLLALGLFTRVVSVKLSVIMVVAILTVEMKNIDSYGKLMDVKDFLYLLILVPLVTYGAGRLSLDHYFDKKYKK